MRGYLKRVLSRVPAPVADWAKLGYDFIPPSVRYGKPYREAVALFRESDWWDPQTLTAYQERLLRTLVHHCYTHVPYYREVFDQSALRPEDISTLKDLQKLPFLTKETVRKRKPDLLARGVSPLKLEWDKTSGTTGAPLDFQIDLSTRAMERALALRQLLWLGYGKGDIIAEIKEDSFADPDRICRYFPGTRQLRFAFFSVDDRKLDRIVQALERFRPAFIKAFPSSLYILARWMERNKRSIGPIKYVITSSENLYPSIKDQAERTFKAPVIDHYGQNEQVAFAFQCAEGLGYHVQIEQCVMELVPARDGEWEIVGTSLRNLGMPFIRYKTGDLAVPGETPCPCGRHHPVISQIKGREGDIIVTPERRIIAPVAMDYAFYHLEEIREAQIVQEDINTLRIKVVSWEELSQATKEALLKEIDSYLQSPTMHVILEQVDEIPRTPRGKKPFIISHIRVDEYI